MMNPSATLVCRLVPFPATKMTNRKGTETKPEMPTVTAVLRPVKVVTDQNFPRYGERVVWPLDRV